MATTEKQLECWAVGKKVVTRKPTRHGNIPVGTVGEIVRIEGPRTDMGTDAHWIVVEFPGQILKHTFPIDATIGKKLQLHLGQGDHDPAEWPMLKKKVKNQRAMQSRLGTMGA